MRPGEGERKTQHPLVTTDTPHHRPHPQLEPAMRVAKAALKGEESARGERKSAEALARLLEQGLSSLVEALVCIEWIVLLRREV